MNTDWRLNLRRFLGVAAIAVVATYALTAWGVATGGGTEEVITPTEVAQQTAMYGTLIAGVLLVLIFLVMIRRGAGLSDPAKSAASRRWFSSGSDAVGDWIDDRPSRNSLMWADGSGNDLPTEPPMGDF